MCIIIIIYAIYRQQNEIVCTVYAFHLLINRVAATSLFFLLEAIAGEVNKI